MKVSSFDGGEYDSGYIYHTLLHCLSTGYYIKYSFITATEGLLGL
jgi:hypothetical protein